MIVLGISCFYHDSAICIMKDGEILFAGEEERFSRLKHDSQFPSLALRAGLDHCKIEADEIDKVIFYEKPFLTYERIFETIMELAPRSFSLFYDSLSKIIKNKLFIKSTLKKHLRKTLKNKDYVIEFCEHHYSHALSAFIPSEFKEAAILCIDGVGEWDTTTVWHGKDGVISKKYSINYPHSIGLFYSLFTEYCGFKANSGEYKMMGLAPYGEPIYVDIIKENFIKVHEDGSIRLNTQNISADFRSDLVMSSLERILGSKKRESVDITQFYKNIACSVQQICEEVVEKMVTFALDKCNSKRVCLAGGVALNCVANGKIAKKIGAENIWIQPAAGDSGGAIGAAMSVWNKKISNFRPILGTQYSSEQIKNIIDSKSLIYQEASVDLIVNDIIDKKVVAIFQGRMEFGPRALGNRSIIAKSAEPSMKALLNEKIKKREGFRPFAPIALEKNMEKLFKDAYRSPFMLFTQYSIGNVCSATSHVDGSSRVQSVTEENGLIFDVLNEYESRTSEQALVNTSFNIRGEPIVESPQNALDCFFDSGIDALCLGDFYIRKSDNNKDFIFFESREFLKD